jgi:hypothetical protein
MYDKFLAYEDAYWTNKAKQAEAEGYLGTKTSGKPESCLVVLNNVKLDIDLAALSEIRTDEDSIPVPYSTAIHFW